MNLPVINLQQSRIIPCVAIILIMTHLMVTFVSMDMLMASYAALLGMLMAFFISVFLLVRKKTLHSIDVYMLIFSITLEGITFLNGTDWKDWLFHSLAIVAFIFIFNYYRYSYYTVIYSILFVLSVAVYCQLFQCIIHPDMWLIDETKQNGGYLLGGNYNQMGIRLIIALTLGIISVKQNKWFWLNFIPLLIASFTVLFMVRSMTSLSCMFLFLVFCLIRNRKLLLIGISGLYVSVVLFQIIVCFSGTGLENNDLARWLIVDVMGKDMTFTGRTEMWDSALRVIADSPIWGYGFVDVEWYRAIMSSRAIGAHNFILNTMVYGGIILLTLYIVIVYKSIKNLININDILSKRLIAAFGIISLMMLFEVYEIQLVFLVLTIMYYYPGKELSAIQNTYARE